MYAWAGGQVVDERAGRCIYDAEDGIGAISRCGVVTVVARVIPELICAVRSFDGGDQLSVKRIDDNERVTSATTDDETLRGSQHKT